MKWRAQEILSIDAWRGIARGEHAHVGAAIKRRLG
jgi:hypothetical protein